MKKTWDELSISQKIIHCWGDIHWHFWEAKRGFKAAWIFHKRNRVQSYFTPYGFWDVWDLLWRRGRR